MTNLEWLATEKKDSLIEFLRAKGFAVDKCGNVCSCNNLLCESCILGDHCSDSRDWLNAEHISYTIPIDTLVDAEVWVRDYVTEEWAKAHFAGFSGNSEYPYYCFTDGRTSWTTEDPDNTAAWRYCKLASDNCEN